MNRIRKEMKETLDGINEALGTNHSLEEKSDPKFVKEIIEDLDERLIDGKYEVDSSEPVLVWQSKTNIDYEGTQHTMFSAINVPQELIDIENREDFDHWQIMADVDGEMRRVNVEKLC
jgi:hypothetical protein